MSPTGIPLPENLEDVFKPRSGSRKPKLLREFWIAFQTPISGRRFVIVSKKEPLRIEDRQVPPSGEGEVHEVLLSDVVSGTYLTVPEKNEASWEKIEGWLRRENLNLSIFEESRGVIRSPGSSNKSEARHITGSTALRSVDWLEALALLDQQDPGQNFHSARYRCQASWP